MKLTKHEPYLILASHTFRREERSGQAVTIKLSPQQKLAVTNEICTVRRLHLLSWSSSYLRVLVDVSILLSAMFNDCVPQQQLIRCSMTTPFLPAKGVACKTNLVLGSIQTRQLFPDLPVLIAYSMRIKREDLERRIFKQ